MKIDLPRENVPLAGPKGAPTDEARVLVRAVNGLVARTGGAPDPVYTVVEAQAITTAPIGSWIYVSNEAGGGVPAFWDGTNWRRCTDRAIIS